jgi:hypothetical protein
MRPMATIRLLCSLLLANAMFGCNEPSGDADGSESETRPHDTMKPQRVLVPVRFTVNKPYDVGVLFSSSGLPGRGVGSKRVTHDGYSWGYNNPLDAKRIADWAVPDMPGAGYVTAMYELYIEYDANGRLNVQATKGRLVNEVINTHVASTLIDKFSPLRTHAGYAQPCLSVVMKGGMEKNVRLQSVPAPHTDKFTGYDWKKSDKTYDGTPISVRNVIMGTLWLTAHCYPDTLGGTHVSGGVGFPPGGFVMVDKAMGPGGDMSHTIQLNLLEDDKGKVHFGFVSSADSILTKQEWREFNAAAATFRAKFAADAARGTQDALDARSNVGP